MLSDVSFSLAPGDAAAIMGPSGSGKSSLLYVLGALEPPTSGTVTLDGRNPFSAPAAELAAFRNESIGFVFQDHCLLPQCTVLENVLIPTLVAHRRQTATAKPRVPASWSSRSASATGSTIVPASCPAASGSGSRSPARWFGSRGCCCATSRPATSIARPRNSVASLLLDLHRQQQDDPDRRDAQRRSSRRKFPIRFELMDRQLHGESDVI